MEKAKILIFVEDQELRQGLAWLLVAQGYDVCMASDPVGTLFQVGFERPDLIILRTSPYDLVEQVRAVSTVPIIALTADDPRAAADSLDRGADCFVKLPPGSGELQAKVRACLRRS